MGSFSIWHWLILIIIAFTIVIPFAQILKRTGHSPIWSIICFIPLLNWIALWVFAFKKWPSDK